MNKTDPNEENFSLETQSLIDRYDITGVVLVGFQDVDDDTTQVILMIHGKIDPIVLVKTAKDLMGRAFARLTDSERATLLIEQLDTITNKMFEARQ